MAFDALEHRNVAEVDRVTEALVRLVACLAFAIGEATEVHRMLEVDRSWNGVRARRIR